MKHSASVRWSKVPNLWGALFGILALSSAFAPRYGTHSNEPRWYGNRSRGTCLRHWKSTRRAVSGPLVARSGTSGVPASSK